MTGNADAPPALPGQDQGIEARRERRLVYGVVREWLSVRRLRSLPSIDDLNPRAFSIDWHWCVLVHLGEGTGSAVSRARFEFVGVGLLEEAPACTAGTSISAVPEGTRLACTIAPIRRLIETEREQPIIAQGVICRPANEILKFRTVALPFADHAGAARYTLGAFSGAAFPRSSLDQRAFLASEVVFETLDTKCGNWVRLPSKRV